MKKLLFASLAIAAMAFLADGQGVVPGGRYAYSSASLPGIPATVAGSSVVTATNAVFQIPAPGDVASYVYLTPASSTTSTVSYNYVFSPDGVNYGTELHPHVITMNGTAAVMGYTNFMRAAGYGNAAWIKLVSISNNTSVVITNGTATIPAATVFSFFP
jgi:hypothetical protein